MGFFKQTWVKILIVVILVLVVGSTAAYLLGTRKNQPIYLTPQTPAPHALASIYLSPTLLLTNADQAKLTATWKTYTNQANKFEVKYPPTWVIDTSHLANTVSTVTFSSPDLKYSTDSGFPSYGATININSEKTNLHDLDELYAQIAGDKFTKVSSKNYIVLDGVKGLRLQVGGVETPDGIDVHFIYHGNHYTLQFWEIRTNYSQVFNQVLSTFTFTEQA